MVDQRRAVGGGGVEDMRWAKEERERERAAAVGLSRGRRRSQWIWLVVGGGWRRGGAQVYASSSMSGTPFLRVSSRPVLSCALAGSPTQLAGSRRRAAYAPTVDRDGFQPCSLVRDRPLPGPRFICAHSTAIQEASNFLALNMSRDREG